MKKESIKAHLVTYSIQRKRTTTINHAFASAIAPGEEFNEARLHAALQLLGQNPNEHLKCVYCDSPAETWDHLVGLVEKKELRGYGHQIGNLVPCCRACNSKKGAKAWEAYLRSVVRDQSLFETRRDRISSYCQQFATQVNLKLAEEKCPDEWKRYCEIKKQIFELIEEADRIAGCLRDAIVSKNV